MHAQINRRLIWSSVMRRFLDPCEEPIASRGIRYPGDVVIKPAEAQPRITEVAEVEVEVYMTLLGPI